MRCAIRRLPPLTLCPEMIVYRNYRFTATTAGWDEEFFNREWTRMDANVVVRKERGWVGW